jgi:hypothetical protein
MVVLGRLPWRGPAFFLSFGSSCKLTPVTNEKDNPYFGKEIIPTELFRRDLVSLWRNVEQKKNLEAQKMA